MRTSDGPEHRRQSEDDIEERRQCASNERKFSATQQNNLNAGAGCDQCRCGFIGEKSLGLQDGSFGDPSSRNDVTASRVQEQWQFKPPNSTSS